MYKPVNQAEFKHASQIMAGDTRNEIVIRLMDRAGIPVNLTDKTVTWSARRGKVQVVEGRAAAVYANGEVGIKFLNADDMQKGTLYIQVDVIWSATETEKFPTNSSLFLLIT